MPSARVNPDGEHTSPSQRSLELIGGEPETVIGARNPLVLGACWALVGRGEKQLDLVFLSPVDHDSGSATSHATSRGLAYGGGSSCRFAPPIAETAARLLLFGMGEHRVVPRRGKH